MAIILVVDDDEDIHQLATLALAADGHQVLTAQDGLSALALIATQPPDLILLDRRLPGEPGDAILAALRANPATATTPVIFLTALRQSEQVAAGLSLGADDYLAKPFDLEELRARVAARLLRARETQALRQQIAAASDQAQRDPLTGLANRRGLLAALQQADANATSVGILALDVDALKTVNDRFGYLAGDAFLIALAERLRAVAGPARCLARTGGDEFVVVIATRSDEPLQQLAEQIRAAIAGAPFTIAGSQVPASISIGCAFAPPGQAVATLEAADRALYRAKADGKNRIAF
ncbi:MAG: diguanylate cyclase response regulator [Dehalococcoidia bacterium]|nr:MAG: diguanylate cyclase response regulator [Dehalococcoidia bacterium]